MTQPESTRSTADAREGSGDPANDPAAIGEQSFTHPDGDGGAITDEAERPA